MRAARAGLTYVTYGDDGAQEPVGGESAGSIRARVTRAARIFEARLLGCYQAGDDDAVAQALERLADESEDAEAGALLEAETANEIHKLHNIAEAWRAANEG